MPKPEIANSKSSGYNLNLNYDGVDEMKSDLESEKRSMQRIWKQRDKQIEKVITNTIDMYGSVKGIAGNAVQSVKALELSGADQDENEQNQLELE